MKKLLTTLFVSLFTFGLYAQDNEPNTLRYYLNDQTTFDVRISELSQVKKIGNAALKNIYSNSNKASKDFLLSQIDSILFVYVDYQDDPEDNNVNKNTDNRALLLEYPRLRSGSNDILSIHSTQNYGITYSLEYDCTERLARWVAYEMHDGNSAKNVSRTDAWADDPNIPSRYRTQKSDFSGFSRGHLCPSSDRLCSAEQNKQTFYYSNMMPQYQNHNGVLWASMEQKVTNTWNQPSFRDTLYVVKAATIYDQLTTTNTGLTVPKYFYMAVLCVKNGQYKAIGLWTLHENVSRKNANLADYAISIDELEEKTGIDFFCNLPDDIEEEVEKNVNLSDWGL